MVKRIDWTLVINDILKSDSNIDFQTIARVTGVHRSTISRLRTNNIEPKYSNGEALLVLWRKSIKDNSAPPTLRGS